MFKNHPNKSKIKFLIHPMIKTSNIVGKDMNEMIKKYGPGTEISQGINFDFSMMYMYGRLDIWYVYTLTKFPKIQEEICRLTYFPNNDTTNYLESSLYILEKYNAYYEKNEDVYNRA